MIEINVGNIGEYVFTGSWDIAASIKPERDSNESKQVTLRFKLNQVPASDVMRSSLKDKRINWQVGGRKKFNEVKAGAVVEVNYEGGRAPVDPITSIAQLASAAGMSVADYIAAEMKRRGL